MVGIIEAMNLQQKSAVLKHWSDICNHLKTLSDEYGRSWFWV